MSNNIIPQTSKRRSPSPVGSGKHWIPIRNRPFRQEIRVDPEQFKVAIAWLDYGDPDRPRKLRTVLSRKAQRDLACKLIEKGVLVRKDNGYILAPECREHLAYYREA
jgi:hypothetical protein